MDSPKRPGRWLRLFDAWLHFASQSAPFIPHAPIHFFSRSSRAQLPCAFDPANAHASRLFTSAFMQRRFHSDPGSGIECRHSLQSFASISSPFLKILQARVCALMTIFLLSSSTAQRKRLLHAFLCVLAAFLRQVPFCFAHILLNTVKKRSIRRTNRGHPINLDISGFHKNWFSKPKPLRQHCRAQYTGNAS